MDPLQWTAREDLFEEVTFIANARSERTSQGKQMSIPGRGMAHAKPTVSLSRSQCGWAERTAEQTEVLKGWQALAGQALGSGLENLWLPGGN